MIYLLTQLKISFTSSFYFDDYISIFGFFFVSWSPPAARVVCEPARRRASKILLYYSFNNYPILSCLYPKTIILYY